MKGGPCQWWVVSTHADNAASCLTTAVAMTKVLHHVVKFHTQMHLCCLEVVKLILSS